MAHQEWISVALSEEEVADALKEKAKALRPDLKQVLDRAVGVGLTTDGGKHFQAAEVVVAFNITDDGPATDAEPGQAADAGQADIGGGGAANAAASKPPAAK